MIRAPAEVGKSIKSAAENNKFSLTDRGIAFNDKIIYFFIESVDFPVFMLRLL